MKTTNAGLSVETLEVDRTTVHHHIDLEGCDDHKKMENKKKKTMAGGVFDREEDSSTSKEASATKKKKFLLLPSVAILLLFAIVGVKKSGVGTNTSKKTVLDDPFGGGVAATAAAAPAAYNHRELSTTCTLTITLEDVSDLGFVDQYRGWYDIGCGKCNAYCRWVGNGYEGQGDPAYQQKVGEVYWACHIGDIPYYYGNLDVTKRCGGPTQGFDVPLVPPKPDFLYTMNSKSGMLHNLMWPDDLGCPPGETVFHNCFSEVRPPGYYDKILAYASDNKGYEPYDPSTHSTPPEVNEAMVIAAPLNVLDNTNTHDHHAGTHISLTPRIWPANPKSLTVETWVMPLSSRPYQRVFDFGMSDASNSEWADNFWAFMLQTEDLTTQALQIKVGERRETMWVNGNLKLNHWYHMVAVFDGHRKEMRVYINGLRYGTLPITTLLSEISTQKLYVGRSIWKADQAAHAAFDEIRTYGNKALTDAEVFASYINGVTTFCNGKSGCANGEVCETSIPSIYDSSFTVPPAKCSSGLDKVLAYYPASCTTDACRKHSTWQSAMNQCQQLPNGECGGITKVNHVITSPYELRAGSDGIFWEGYNSGDESYKKQCYDSATMDHYGLIPNRDGLNQFEKWGKVPYNECTKPATVVERPRQYQMITDGDGTVAYWESDEEVMPPCMTFSVRAANDVSFVSAYRRDESRVPQYTKSIPFYELSSSKHSSFWLCHGAHYDLSKTPPRIGFVYGFGRGDVAFGKDTTIEFWQSGDPEAMFPMNFVGFQSNNKEYAHWAKYKSIGAPDGFLCYSDAYCANSCVDGICVAKSCNGHSDCNSHSSYCADLGQTTGKCLPKMEDWEECTADVQCLSGACIKSFEMSLGLSDKRICSFI